MSHCANFNMFLISEAVNKTHYAIFFFSCKSNLLSNSSFITFPNAISPLYFTNFHSHVLSNCSVHSICRPNLNPLFGPADFTLNNAN